MNARSLRLLWESSSFNWTMSTHSSPALHSRRFSHIQPLFRNMLETNASITAQTIFSTSTTTAYSRNLIFRNEDHLSWGHCGSIEIRVLLGRPLCDRIWIWTVSNWAKISGRVAQITSSCFKYLSLLYGLCRDFSMLCCGILTRTDFDLVPGNAQPGQPSCYQNNSYDELFDTFRCTNDLRRKPFINIGLQKWQSSSRF